jgi:hypothetical protein
MRLARWFILLVLASLMGCSNVNSNEVVAIENTGVYRRRECPPVQMAKAVPMSPRGGDVGAPQALRRMQTRPALNQG